MTGLVGALPPVPAKNAPVACRLIPAQGWNFSIRSVGLTGLLCAFQLDAKNPV